MARRILARAGWKLPAALVASAGAAYVILAASGTLPLPDLRAQGEEREGQDNENRAADAEALGSAVFPAQEGALRIQRLGASEIRAGQKYEYSLRVENISDHMLVGVKVTETVSPSFSIQQSEPRFVQAEGKSLSGSEVQKQFQGRQGARGQQGQQGAQGQQDQHDQKGQQGAQGQQGQQDQQGQQGAQGQRSGRNRRERGNDDRPRGTNAQTRGQSGPNAEGAASAEPQERARPQQGGGQGARRDRISRDAQAGQRGQNRGQQGQQGQQEDSMRAYVWEIGTLPPGEYRDIRVVGVPTRPEPIESCVVAEFHSALCTKLDVTKPELAIAAAIVDENDRERDWVYACENPRAIFRVANTGDAAAQDVQLVAELPQGLQSAEGQQALEVEIGNIPAGETIDKAVELRPRQSGRYTIRARAVSGTQEVYATPAEFRVLVPSLDVRISGPKTEYVGRTVEHEITVSNTGDDPAIDTTLLVSEAVLGDRATFSTQEIAEEGNAVELGVLEPGESKSFRYRFRATATGEASAKLVATAFCADEVTKTISTEIQGIPALQLEVVDSQDPVPVGESTVYTVQIINEGSAPDTNIQLAGELAENLRFTEGNGPTKVSGQSQKVQFAPVDQLPPGESATWRITAEGAQAGNARFVLRVKSDQQKQQLLEIEPTTVQ